jgi:hypothetical protein
MTKQLRFATLLLTLLVLVAHGFSEVSDKRPDTTPTQNLVRGVSGPVGGNNDWSNYTLWGVIPGSALFPIASTTTVLSYGFTAGSEADISNMVLYTTAHGSSTITAVTPVTYGGLSNPSINLASTSICPTAPSTATPCIVKFDSINLTLSPANDYYFAVFFTSDSNNSSIGATAPASQAQSSLWGWYTGGNSTTLTVGNSISIGSHSTPYFFMYVTNN